MGDNVRRVELPAELCERIEKRFGTQGRNLEQFLIFAMQELLQDDAAQMDEAEKRMIEQRLKDLGYI
jgi:hypothetical protein